METVISLTGCSTEAAEKALQTFNGDIVQAVDSLLAVPIVACAKHIPKPREIDRGLTPEQEELCANGRALMDKLTAVASAAHSKIRSGQSLAGGVVEQASRAQEDETPAPASEPPVEQSK